MSDVGETRLHMTRGQVLGVTPGNALEFYDFLVFSFSLCRSGNRFFRVLTRSPACSVRSLPSALGS